MCRLTLVSIDEASVDCDSIVLRSARAYAQRRDGVRIHSDLAVPEWSDAPGWTVSRSASPHTTSGQFRRVGEER